MKFLGNIFDLENSPLLNAIIERDTTFPLEPEEGRLFYYLTDHTYYYFNGTEWVSLTGGGESPTNNFAETISSWETQGNLFYKDLIHGFNTYDLSISGYSLASGKELGFEEIERLDLNTIRVWSATNTETVRVLVIRKASDSYSNTIVTWVESGFLFYNDVFHNLGTLDICVSTFNVTGLKNVGVEEIERLNENVVRIWVSNNIDTIRVFVIKA